MSDHLMPAKRTVWLHVHVPKAGGSTLRQLFNRNFGRGYYNSVSLLETKQYTRSDVSEIIRCHPWVSAFSDHKLSLDLPFDHPEALVLAIAYVRDPVDRFISRYFFHRHFEQVSCVAQQTTFRQFAEMELVQKHAHPQTNSQILFLNGNVAETDLAVIHHAVQTGQAYVFPIERFDESCIFLERTYPQYFPDLSYVMANVSTKDQDVTEDERQFVAPLLSDDRPLMQLADRQLDAALNSAFPSLEDRLAALEEFRDRCARRFDNFQPPRPKSLSPSPSTR